MFKFTKHSSLKTLSLIFFLTPLLAMNAYAALEYYIRAGASGADGSDWDNAFPSIPSPLVRGATYWIADGNYGSYTFDDSGSSVITVKHANPLNHGTDIGWDDSMGRGRAVFGTVIFKTNNWVLDGNTNILGTYGIEIVPSSTSAVALNLGYKTDSLSGVEIHDVSINCQNANDVSPTPRGIYVSSSSNIHLKNIEIHHPYQDGVKLAFASNITFDGMYIRDRQYSNENIHADGFEIVSSSNITIKNSSFDWNGQQIFFGGDVSGPNGRFDIHGNSFYGGPTSGQGICRNSRGTGGPVYVNNNSFYDLNTQIIEGGMNYQQVNNNIFIAGNDKSLSLPNLSHNYYSSDISGYNDLHAQIGENPFTDAINGDFKLTNPTDAGDSSIASIYGYDCFGNQRGEDGNWDRGAVEYVGSGDTPAVSPPKGLRIVTMAAPIVVASSLKINRHIWGRFSRQALFSDKLSRNGKQPQIK